MSDAEHTLKRDVLRVTEDRQASARCRDCPWTCSSTASAGAGSSHAAGHRHEVVVDYRVRYAYVPRAGRI